MLNMQLVRHALAVDRVLQCYSNEFDENESGYTKQNEDDTFKFKTYFLYIKIKFCLNFN